jgi:hypothetical protein
MTPISFISKINFLAPHPSLNEDRGVIFRQEHSGNSRTKVGISNWVNNKRGLWLDTELSSTAVLHKDHSLSHSL